jgi:hypothetical protein
MNIITVMWFVHEPEYDLALILVLRRDGGPESCKHFVGRSALANYGTICVLLSDLHPFL